jgi:hypothetical protein
VLLGLVVSADRWKRNTKDSKINQQYYMVNGNKTICAVCVSGEPRFELWVNGVFKMDVRGVNNFKEAIERLSENGM